MGGTRAGLSFDEQGAAFLVGMSRAQSVEGETKVMRGSNLPDDAGLTTGSMYSDCGAQGTRQSSALDGIC